MRGRATFRRFRDKLHELGLEDQWYEYRQVQYERIARDWCEANDIEVIE